MKKYALSILILTMIVSTVNVDAISVFGKDLNFGKLFNKAKPATPISAVVDSKVNFDVTSPKKGVTLETGNITNITWKTNDKIEVYNLTLEGGQKYDLGKAYNAGKLFSWMISKDIKPGNYKLVFTDKFGNKYKSDEFKIKTAIENQSYKIESSVGTPVTDKSYYNIDYKITTLTGSDAEFNIKLTCPAGVSAVSGQDRNDKCNKIIAGNPFSKSVSKSNEYNLTLSFTNKTKTSQLVTAEFSANGKSRGKVVNMVEPTKEVVVSPIINFTYPTAGSNMYLGKTNEITWTTNVSDPNVYSVYLIDSTPDTEPMFLGTTVLNQKKFSIVFPSYVSAGNDYQLSFSGKGATGGLSQKFNIVKPGPSIVAISSTASVIKNNNYDMGISVNMKSNFTANGFDVYVKNSDKSKNMTAIIGLRNMSDGSIIATSQPINVITEDPSVYVFADGTTRLAQFNYVFSTSSLPTGVTNVQAFLQSVTYTPVNESSSKIINTELGVFNSNTVTVDVTSRDIFTRDLTIGSIGVDVENLRKFLANKGFLPPMTYQNTSNYFDSSLANILTKFQQSVLLSPATGVFGPMTRAYVNAHFNDPAVDITKCPQSLTLYNVTYTITPCSINTSMIDGAGDKAFTVYIVPSVSNSTYSYYTYGYGVGLPTYGILGGGSGGAFATTTLNLNFADSVLSKGVYKGYLPIHIGNGNNDNNFLYFNFNLEVK